MHNIGDQIVTIETLENPDFEQHIVSKIIEIYDIYGKQFYYCTQINGSVQFDKGTIEDDMNYIPVDDPKIKGLYDGWIQHKDGIWAPKYGIGDAILVKWDWFSEPTWHTILGINFTRLNKEKTFGYLLDKFMAEEHHIIDEIRYNGTM
jgi:hypothetical protein